MVDHGGGGCMGTSVGPWTNIPAKFVLVTIASFYVILTSSYILPRSYRIVVYRDSSCWFVSQLCVFLSVRCDSKWVGLVRSTSSYYIDVHRVYTVSIIFSLYVIVAHPIVSYLFAPDKQHEPVRIRGELIGMLTR